jgi:SET domain
MKWCATSHPLAHDLIPSKDEHAGALIKGLNLIDLRPNSKLPVQDLNSFTTSATSSYFPSAALSHASYNTPETSDDSDTEDRQSPSFIVRQTKDRGLSLFATRRIVYGSVVLTEEPLISLPRNLETDYSEIEAAFKALSKTKQKSYRTLYDAEKSRMSSIVSIYYSNCYSTDSFSEDGGSCIGVLSSRINHSCIPNICFAYTPPSPGCPSGRMTFHAVKNIPAGKELLSTYEKNIFLPRDQRKRRLLMDYGFHCDCEACVPKSAFWERSDQRRKTMGELVKTAKSVGSEWDKRRDETAAGLEKQRVVVEAIELLTKLEELLLKEGLLYTPLANVYRSLAKWSNRFENAGKQKEMEWKKKELEICLACFGGKCERSRELKKELRDWKAEENNEE